MSETPHPITDDITDDIDIEPEVEFIEIARHVFADWGSKSRGGRGAGEVVLYEGHPDDLSRRLIVTVRETPILRIETWRDQWGVWIWGTDPIADPHEQAGPHWVVAQEDGTPSFLHALIQGLTWLRQDDLGTPREEKPHGS